MTLRNESLQALAAQLQREESRKLDAVASVASIRAQEGNILVDGIGEAELTDTGVSSGTAKLVTTPVALTGLADKLGIPGAYLRKCRETLPSLFDANVNGWLRDGDQGRKLLLRTFRDAETGGGFPSGGLGVLRAVLSDSYLTIDNFDVLLAVLQGIRDAGHEVKIDRADLTDRRMIVHVQSETVAEAAPELLRGYRSPYSGNSGADNPLISAGFVISNSEVGSGAFSIVPELTVQICTNGLTMTKEAMRAVHLGAKLDEGVVRASQQTQERQLALITSRSQDAVQEFLSGRYLRSKITQLEESAGVPVTDAPKTIELVSKSVGFTQAQQSMILDDFIKGGQLTAGGVMQAVTSAAQRVEDGDDAYDMQLKGVEAMLAAARLR